MILMGRQPQQLLEDAKTCVMNILSVWRGHGMGTGGAPVSSSPGLKEGRLRMELCQELRCADALDIATSKYWNICRTSIYDFSLFDFCKIPLAILYVVSCIKLCRMACNMY